MSFTFLKPHTPQSYASRSEVGCVREHNEDSFLEKSPLFVVADGMGGHEAGEVASRIAVSAMEARIPKKPNPEALEAAVIAANEAVIRGAKDGTGKPGMGTTLTAALVYDEEVIIAQVGDSRAYLLHDGALQRITRDHSLIADLIEQGRITETEARYHPQRSVITRALGSDPNMRPDIYSLCVEEGDKLLLCSDGLSTMLTDDMIESILRAQPNPKLACDDLVQEAIASGGLDNVTVIVVDPLGTAEEPMPDAEETVVVNRVVGAAPDDAEPARGVPISMSPGAHSKSTLNKAKRKKEAGPKQKGRFAPLLWTIAFVAILVAAALGFYAYAQNSYYVIQENGIVCVYRGLPGEIGTLRFSWLEQKATGIDVKKLNPTTQNRLEKGISVDSLDEANKLIAEYQSTSSQG